MVLETTPLPALPAAPAREGIEPRRTKKAVLLALYGAHPDYGDRTKASRVAAELAPQAGLQPGPPGATCTPNRTAGHHDHGRAR
jgi:hypothetical protein